MDIEDFNRAQAEEVLIQKLLSGELTLHEYNKQSEALEHEQDERL